MKHWSLTRLLTKLCALSWGTPGQNDAARCSAKCCYSVLCDWSNINVNNQWGVCLFVWLLGHWGVYLFCFFSVFSVFFSFSDGFRRLDSKWFIHPNLCKINENYLIKVKQKQVTVWKQNYFQKNVNILKCNLQKISIMSLNSGSHFVCLNIL